MNLTFAALAHLLNTADQAALQAFSSSAAAALITAIWQSAAIAISLALTLRLVPRTSAALRFSLWLAALGILLALPLISLIPCGLASNGLVLVHTATHTAHFKTLAHL